MTVIYNYGFLFTYGIGFGYPLLLGLPDDTKSCGRDDFLDTLSEYGLEHGVSYLLQQGVSASDIQSVLIEFERVVATQLSCIDSSENEESQIATNAVGNLLAAMNARLEVSNSRSSQFSARKLEEQADQLPIQLDIHVGSAAL